ncbi:hypothetical protein CDAR_506301, partial [Caerostris darwini]
MDDVFKEMEKRRGDIRCGSRGRKGLRYGIRKGWELIK